MATPGCYYATWGSYAFGWTHFLPVFITTSFSVMSVVYSEFLFALLGLYFFGAWFALWIVQYNYGIYRRDPYCAVYHAYAVPSSEIFYTVALLTFVLAYVFTAPVGQEPKVGVYGWVCVLSIGFVPAFFLFIYQMNTWQEVLGSVLIAVIPTVAFVWLLRRVVQPNMAYLLLSPPFSWWGYESHFLRSTPQELQAAENARRARQKLNF